MLTIIGCGNTTRSDDGAGIATVQRLLQELSGAPPPGVQIFDAGTAGVEVLFKARGSSALILVDASSSGSEPGAVFEVPGSELERASAPGLGLHGFRWEHALHAGRLIFKDQFPEQVAVYLIEGERLELGVGLSPAVERAVWRVVAMLRGKIAEASVSEKRVCDG
jgi:hydrogenase maturation protease